MSFLCGQKHLFNITSSAKNPDAANRPEQTWDARWLLRITANCVWKPRCFRLEWRRVAISSSACISNTLSAPRSDFTPTQSNLTSSCFFFRQPVNVYLRPLLGYSLFFFFLKAVSHSSRLWYIFSIPLSTPFQFSTPCLPRPVFFTRVAAFTDTVLLPWISGLESRECHQYMSWGSKHFPARVLLQFAWWLQWSY